MEDETKLHYLGDIEIAQMISYLRITQCRVGFIINFKSRRIETRKIVL
ncbi:MAG: hypothetical protein RLZZ522_1699 [Verrucomicrobiota bacterium]